MTTGEDKTPADKQLQSLEELCENTRAIRRVVNRILDHLHEYQGQDDYDYDPDTVSWNDLDGYDDMYL